MKTYRGIRNPDRTATVTVDGAPLDPRLDLANHSSACLAWGNGGSGAAQLALALLADHFHDLPDGNEMALEFREAFKWHAIRPLVGDWTLTSDDMEQTLYEIGDGVE